MQLLAQGIQSMVPWHRVFPRALGLHDKVLHCALHAGRAVGVRLAVGVRCLPAEPHLFGGVGGALGVEAAVGRELEDALNPLGMIKEGAQKVRDYFTSKPAPAGSVTKTEKSVTVAPRKRGGSAMC